jgi:hypothetical protein
VKTRYASKYAKDNGYDGVIVTNVMDHGPYEGEDTLYAKEFGIDLDQEYDDEYAMWDAYYNRSSDFATDVFIAFESN